MQLIFRKSEEGEVTVLQVVDGAEHEFNYPEMIKALLDDETLEVPLIEGDFGQEEIGSIKSMAERINKAAQGPQRDEDEEPDVGTEGDADDELFDSGFENG